MARTAGTVRQEPCNREKNDPGRSAANRQNHALSDRHRHADRIMRTLRPAPESRITLTCFTRIIMRRNPIRANARFRFAVLSSAP